MEIEAIDLEIRLQMTAALRFWIYASGPEGDRASSDGANGNESHSNRDGKLGTCYIRDILESVG